MEEELAAEFGAGWRKNTMGALEVEIRLEPGWVCRVVGCPSMTQGRGVCSSGKSPGGVWHLCDG